MKGLVHIGSSDIRIKEYKGRRVVTFEEIDVVHERSSGTAKRNFNKNMNRFIENEDYFRLGGDELKSYKVDFDGTKFVPTKTNRELILITESGYLMLAKSLNDDLAWRVQRQLVNGYFRSREFLKRQQADPRWREARYLSKLTRRAEISVIRDFVEYAKLKGSKGADTYYVHFSKLVNSAVGIDSSERNVANTKTLATIELLEDLISHTVIEGMRMGNFYKDIYKDCKMKVGEAMRFVFLPEGNCQGHNLERGIKTG